MSGTGPQGSRAHGQEARWRQYARRAAAGFYYHAYHSSTSRGSSAHTAADTEFGTGQHQQAGHEWVPPSAALFGAAVGSSMEHQVQAELAALLAQSGGDLLRLVAALGIPFPPAADRRGSLRNARAAALLRLHPDKLVQRTEREQVFGLLATKLVNELWKAGSASR